MSSAQRPALEGVLWSEPLPHPVLLPLGVRGWEEAVPVHLVRFAGFTDETSSERLRKGHTGNRESQEDPHLERRAVRLYGLEPHRRTSQKRRRLHETGLTSGTENNKPESNQQWPQELELTKGQWAIRSQDEGKNKSFPLRPASCRPTGHKAT